MKLSELVQKMIKNFLIIFASIMIMITILRQIYYPAASFDLKTIYILMAFSFLSSLTGFILYSPNDVSERKLRIRMAIHFCSLEILLIALCSVFGILHRASDGILLALQIAVIYLIVRLLSYRNDKKESQKINEKLNALKKNG